MVNFLMFESTRVSCSSCADSRIEVGLLVKKPGTSFLWHSRRQEHCAHSSFPFSFQLQSLWCAVAKWMLHRKGDCITPGIPAHRETNTLRRAARTLPHNFPYRGMLPLFPVTENNYVTQIYTP